MTYKIEWLINDTYQVIDSEGIMVYQSTLADCVAYKNYRESTAGSRP